uniref:D-isomer specific 2-hydroxyacid dehydrogenase catalytic domain-containing protein n=1 Tax=Ditylenchus dipsaci TaxID=166011 RepID=A0A915ECW5_9BILA
MPSLETQPKLKVVVSDAAFTVDKICKVANVVQHPTLDHSKLLEWVMKEIVDADVLFCRGPLPVDKLMLDQAKHLKAVVTMAVGYDNIDVVECNERGIKMGYAGNCLTEATAEFTVALLLATSRRILEAVHFATLQIFWANHWKLL